MSPLLKFTVLRIALFLAALVVLYLIGARDWLLLILAALVSLALSYVLLRAPREELAASIEQRVSQRLAEGGQRRSRRRKSAAERDAALEDAVVDQNVDHQINHEINQETGGPKRGQEDH